MSAKTQYWAVLPAAGSGKRMQQTLPKQYLSIQGKTVAEHTLDRFLSVSRIEKVVVSVAEDDPYWPQTDCATHNKIVTAQGGSERFESVLNGLLNIESEAQDQDWVLVHDIARPCIRISDIYKLMHELEENEVGGLLAIPVRDTMKRVSTENSVEETVDRTNLWHALTPQMFRYGLLKKALQEAVANKLVVTDEASAIEMLGLKPKIVEGARDNIKITFPDDLILAKFYLQQQAKQSKQLYNDIELARED